MKMKKIGTAIYAHCSNYDNLTENIKNMVDIATVIMLSAGMMLEWLGSVIYKVDAKNKKVTFIESEDFDTAREPQVGNSYTVDLDAEKIKITKAKGQIYHHKWMFVDESYKGFDIEESKRSFPFIGATGKNTCIGNCYGTIARRVLSSNLDR